ncbi:hypothetical protein E2320_001734 [Naja naja]|nr:hypothetical protein E2320_001734 [Naja naja]
MAVAGGSSGGAATGSSPRSSLPPLQGISAAPLSPSAAEKVNSHGMLWLLPSPHHAEGSLLAYPAAGWPRNSAHPGLLPPGCWFLVQVLRLR